MAIEAGQYIIDISGMRGPSASHEFSIVGLDGGDPDQIAMFAALQAPALASATTAGLAAANANAKAALAQGVVDAQAYNMEVIADAVEDVSVARDETQESRDQSQASANLAQEAAVSVSADLLIVAEQTSAVIAVGQDVDVKAADVATTATQTQGYRDAAAVSAQIAVDVLASILTSAQRYPDYATGFGVTTSGQYFLVMAPSVNVFAELYRNPSSTPLASFPSATALNAVAALANSDTISAYHLVELAEDGAVLRSMAADGSNQFVGVRLGADGQISTDGYAVLTETIPGIDFIFQDDGGAVSFYAGPAGFGANATGLAPTAIATILASAADQSQAQLAAATPDILSAAESAATASVGQYITETSAEPLTVEEDQNGTVYGAVLADGSRQWAGGTLSAAGDLDTGTFAIRQDAVAGVSFICQTDAGDVLFFAGDAGFNGGGDDSGGGTSTGYTDEEIAARDAAQCAISATATQHTNVSLRAFLLGTTHFISIGQSLSYGSQSYPALSIDARAGNYMIGGSTRPNSSTSTTAVGGTANLQPLIATVLDNKVTPNTVMSPSQVALLGAPPGPNGDGNPGEDPITGFVNALRDFWQQDRPELSPDTYRFVGSSVGQPGTTVQQGAGTQAMDRVSWALTAGQSLVQSGTGYLAPLIIHMQGEGNFQMLAADYLPLHIAVRDAVQARRTAAGVTAPWAFLTYQTDMTQMSNSADGGPAMAQLMASNQEANWFLATPTYFVPKRRPHLTCNGSRWIGAQMAKIANKILRGEPWRPLQPTSLTYRGRECLMTFHVPYPPLSTSPCFDETDLLEFDDLGFTFYDSAGRISPGTVTIVGNTVIRATLPREPADYLLVRYADAEFHSYGGNLCDSDPTTTIDLFEYHADTGQDAGENLPSLVGQPYDLRNRCAAFHLTATAD